MGIPFPLDPPPESFGASFWNGDLAKLGNLVIAHTDAGTMIQADFKPNEVAGTLRYGSGMGWKWQRITTLDECFEEDSVDGNG
ncbi:hypothetical protein N7492_003882 [Penicillium capsulatum]|uniref:Uncharacterized protein n=1 Tax=Penicillium capsulatum TaxID=69766 RepID=A0A9W9IMW0_9EURO|nr:hypothetical protein N7492_003882 [Penicillium capsulatum]